MYPPSVYIVLHSNCADNHVYKKNIYIYVYNKIYIHIYRIYNIYTFLYIALCTSNIFNNISYIKHMYEAHKRNAIKYRRRLIHIIQFISYTFYMLRLQLVLIRINIYACILYFYILYTMCILYIIWKFN